MAGARQKRPSMEFDLQPHEIRVLGCLIEKRFSTPDSYPLTLNSLVTACNQSSNRDPVLQYDTMTVDAALKSTRIAGYSLIQTSAEARVAKFKENVCEKLELDRDQAAILAELMLRGPQTPGELRQRCTRMYEFPDLASVDLALESLGAREEPLVVQLPRQPGKREIRYAHLLAGPVEFAESSAPAPVVRGSDLEERIAALEEQMEQVLERLSRLVDEA